MRKLLGYIPLDDGEDCKAIAKETDVISIEGCWFKLVEVWIPGTAIIPNRKINIEVNAKKDEFRPDTNGKLCINCGKPRDEHVFFTICPKNTNDEKEKKLIAG